MTRLDGRVAIVTGAGRGLGREHALHLAREGARVVVNDLGGSLQGAGADETPAKQVVAEIEAMGGEAVVSAHNVAVWDEAREMIELAVDTFGDLHVLVNNAGILRDKTLANMEEEDWDAVLGVHLKGHAAPTRHAVAYWRRQAKETTGVVKASVIMTSSIAGLAGNFGQANYSSAKLAVLALSQVVNVESSRYGVRSNVVSPGGRTRLSMSTPGAAEDAPPPGVFDPLDPAHVSPLVAWLAAPDCPASGQVFHITGDHLVISRMPPVLHQHELGRQWTLDDLDEWVVPRLVDPPQVTDWIPASRLSG